MPKTILRTRLPNPPSDTTALDDPLRRYLQSMVDTVNALKLDLGAIQDQIAAQQQAMAQAAAAYGTVAAADGGGGRTATGGGGTTFVPGSRRGGGGPVTPE